jgi:hypothetical protein
MNKRLSMLCERASWRIYANRLQKMPCLRPFGVPWQGMADANCEAAIVCSCLWRLVKRSRCDGRPFHASHGMFLNKIGRNMRCKHRTLICSLYLATAAQSGFYPDIPVKLVATARSQKSRRRPLPCMR